MSKELRRRVQGRDPLKLLVLGLHHWQGGGGDDDDEEEEEEKVEDET